MSISEIHTPPKVEHTESTFITNKAVPKHKISVFYFLALFVMLSHMDDEDDKEIYDKDAISKMLPKFKTLKEMVDFLTRTKKIIANDDNKKLQEWMRALVNQIKNFKEELKDQLLQYRGIIGKISNKYSSNKRLSFTCFNRGPIDKVTQLCDSLEDFISHPDEISLDKIEGFIKNASKLTEMLQETRRKERKGFFGFFTKIGDFFDGDKIGKGIAKLANAAAAAGQIIEAQKTNVQCALKKEDGDTQSRLEKKDRSEKTSLRHVKDSEHFSKLLASAFEIRA